MLSLHGMLEICMTNNYPLKTNIVIASTRTLAIIPVMLAWILSTNAQTCFTDNFDGNTLDPRWIVVNPNSNSTVTLTGSGNLELHPSGLSGGSDYSNGLDYQAPRVLTAVSGDWIIETQMSFNPLTDDDEGAGILLLTGNDPTATNGVRAAEYHTPVDAGDKLRMLSSDVSFSSSSYYLKIKKQGNQLTGWYGQDSTHLYPSVQITDASAYTYVGVFATQVPWDPYTVRTSSIDYFKFTPLPQQTISSFTPVSGNAGTTVTITGTNFDPTPSNNIVQFNGVTATVSASTSTSIDVTVPNGATTGNLTVTIGCSSVIAGTFTIGSSAATINVTSQPSSTYAVCDGTTQVISTIASGTTNIAYQWQILNSGSYIDLTNTGGYSNVSTSSLTINSSGNFGAGTYRCRINGDFASIVYTNTVSFSVNPLPATPSASNVSFCPPNSVVLSASGASNGQYLWYDQNGLISGQTNSSYTTSVLSATTNYSVAVTNGFCTSVKTGIAAIASIASCPPPQITSKKLSTQIEGQVTLDLKPLISTPGSSIDVSSLQIIVPPKSGARASISANEVLIIDYYGISFSGKDSLTIKACDLNGNCSQNQFKIDVIGEIEVFNGVSPDGANPTFIIQYIDVLSDTRNNAVSIFDRWENLVWHGANYDNNSVVFTGNGDSGNALPSGVYFYKIEFASGRTTKTGFIALRRQ